MKIQKLLAILIICGFSQLSHAQNCGDYVSSDITFTADLHCTSGYTALEVIATGVTIDLNGFILSGSNALAGISTNGYDRLTVKNGSIKGFWAGVRTHRSNHLTVHDMTFYEVGLGVTIKEGTNGRIYRNDFIKTTSAAVHISNTDSKRTANNNAIFENEFYRAVTGINICGDQADNNTITDNLIWKSSDRGIDLNRSDNNTIKHNRIYDTTGSAIRLNNASYNTLIGNSLRNGDHNGLSILADAGDACLNSGSTHSVKNQFTGNHAIEFQKGVLLGLGSTTAAQVIKNTITGNKLYDNQLGIKFETDAHSNDATGNAYTGSTIAVEDNGSGNSY